jgi:ubiquinone/menaquinone biosynthesis C-methylase UbiE
MFTDPIKNLKAIPLKENDIVADFGAGTGYYSILSGHLVPKGKVYAIEIQKDFINIIHDKIKTEHLKNIEVLWGNIEKIGGTKLADDIVNVVIMSNVLFQVEDKNQTIKEAHRVLKVGGEILLIDWSDSSTLISQRKINIVPKDKMREMFEKNNFVFVREVDAGIHHYGMIFKKVS